MRTTILKLVKRIDAVTQLPQPIYEFGAGHTVGQESRGKVRDFFRGRNYVASDMEPGIGVDRVLDVQRLDLPSEVAGTAILLETIEHVEKPWLALQELHRVLAPGGVVILSSVMFFPVHLFPDDYWRFTASGFRSLLAPFDDCVVTAAGMRTLPHSVVGIGFKAPVAAEMKGKIADAVEAWRRHDATSWKEIALAALPPWMLVKAYDWYVARNIERAKKKG
ncbi:MAG TPA: methyltransferase domain-containing protein [Terriglobales bacterium]|nr:methyltransferase domain-containing protein [Terriglobales bacterium]